MTLIDRLEQFRNLNKLPHAILVASYDIPETIKKIHQWQKKLLCEQQQACDQCHSCRLFTQGVHPDVFWLNSQDETIKIDQIRELIDFSHIKTQYSQTKFVGIAAIEAVNTQATNALLKTLEEPVNDSCFVLITSHMVGLLATLRSRCVLFHDTENHFQYDQEFYQAVLDAFLRNDLIQQIETWKSLSPKMVLNTLWMIMSHLIEFYTLQRHPQLSVLSKHFSKEQAWYTLNSLATTMRHTTKGLSYNFQLYLESLLIKSNGV